MNLPESSIFPAALTQPRAILNGRNGASYTLIPLTAENMPEDMLAEQIAVICNEPPIYDLLFAERCGTNPYARTDAERFLNWARRGWREQTHFVYLICDGAGAPAGAIDIKSANPVAAEIGYWLSAAHSGVMTNAVLALCTLAHSAGYASLYALVRVVNERSANVLRRAGFAVAERFVKNGIPYARWTRTLTG